jgi:hypothetical protein
MERQVAVFSDLPSGACVIFRSLEHPRGYFAKTSGMNSGRALPATKDQEGVWNAEDIRPKRFVPTHRVKLIAQLEEGC